ncbi:MAG: RNA-guided endonuclease TnpB family protein [Xenococcaceae cyanobacterium]
MSKAKTTSFVTEVPLIASSQDRKILSARFDAARQLYNACLNEAECRRRRYQGSEEYQEAKKLPRTISNKKGEPKLNPERIKAFRLAKTKYSYTEFDLHAFSKITAQSSVFIDKHLDSLTIQKIASRAFAASEKIIFGVPRKVRFKSRFRSITSCEGKTNGSGIRFKDEQLIWNTGYDKLTLRIKVERDANGNVVDPVIRHGLNSPIKYCRIVKGILNGKTRYFLQLINKGLPYNSPNRTIGNQKVGVDINLSIVAVVGDETAMLREFCPSVDEHQKDIKRLQRKLDRSRRANNPDNYEPDFYGKRGRKHTKKKGKNKKKKKGQKWNRTKKYERTRAKLAEMERKKAASRKSAHGRLANQILSIGKHIQMEDISLKGWQKMWGHKIKAKAPGSFKEILTRKAESADGKVELISTWDTALSQHCVCGHREKKSLRDRVHECPECGRIMQRDLLSAYLAKFVTDGIALSLTDAQEDWSSLELVLLAEWSRSSEKYNNCQAIGRVPIDYVAADAVQVQELFLSLRDSRQESSLTQTKNSHQGELSLGD